MVKVLRAKVVENAAFGALLGFLSVFTFDDVSTVKVALAAAGGAALAVVKSWAASKVGDGTSTNFFGQPKG
jgi:hypothetical protein